MIRQAGEIATGSVLEAEVCIVGAGAAGISVALELAGRGRQVLLLEAGFDQDDAATQALYAGEVADEAMHSPPDKYRQRRLGGSTTIWGGRCMPFDPIDFEARDWVPASGWPIGWDDVAPYYPRAGEVLETGEFEYDAARALRPPVPPMIEGFNSKRVLTDGLERFSVPTNFGRRYRRRLEQAAGLTVLLGANVTGLRLAPDGTRVDSLDVATLQGTRFAVRAQQVVLALGGLETARLLLASNDVAPQGVGNSHDVVGRYYMCHVAGVVGSLVIEGPTTRVRHGYEISPDGVYCRRRIQLAADEQRRLRVPNLVARLHFPRISDPAHRNGVLSGLFLAQSLISYEYGKRLRDGSRRGLGLWLKHVRNVLLSPLDTAGFLLHWVRKRTLAERKFPSVIVRNKTNRFSLDVHAEQIPRPESRVTLSGERDALGVPRLRVDWRYGADDIEGVRRTLGAFAETVAASGVGRYEFDEGALEQDLMRFGAYGGHHVGTARMGSDPRTSVVDANCKVHGMDNLFIAGSAVFPTSSQANPTLTIVALALRLADHLLGRSAPAEGRM